MSSPSPSPAVVLNGDLPRAQNRPALLCSQAQIVTCQINLKKKIAKKKTDLKKKEYLVLNLNNFQLTSERELLIRKEE